MLIAISDSFSDRKVEFLHEILDTALDFIVVDQIGSVAALKLLQVYIILILTLRCLNAWGSNKKGRNVCNLGSSQSERLGAKYGIDEVLLLDTTVVIFRHFLEKLALSVNVLEFGGACFLEKFSQTVEEAELSQVCVSPVSTDAAIEALTKEVADFVDQFIIFVFIMRDRRSLTSIVAHKVAQLAANILLICLLFKISLEIFCSLMLFLDCGLQKVFTHGVLYIRSLSLFFIEVVCILPLQRV